MRRAPAFLSPSQRHNVAKLTFRESPLLNPLLHPRCGHGAAPVDTCECRGRPAVLRAAGDANVLRQSIALGGLDCPWVAAVASVPTPSHHTHPHANRHAHKHAPPPQQAHQAPQPRPNQQRQCRRPARALNSRVLIHLGATTSASASSTSSWPRAVLDAAGTSVRPLTSSPRRGGRGPENPDTPTALLGEPGCTWFTREGHRRSSDC